MTQQTKVIIDTDPGVDDAMAIIYACLDPRIELLGLTSIAAMKPVAYAADQAVAAACTQWARKIVALVSSTIVLFHAWNMDPHVSWKRTMATITTAQLLDLKV